MKMSNNIISRCAEALVSESSARLTWIMNI